MLIFEEKAVKEAMRFTSEGVMKQLPGLEMVAFWSLWQQ